MIIQLFALTLATTAPHSVGVRCDPSDTTFFSGTAIADREAWYGTHLRASAEARLCPGPGRELFRFLWLRSFHPPVIVRIERNSQGYALVAKVLTGAGGYDPGKIGRTTEHVLSAEDMRKFKEHVRSAWFWQSPTVPPPSGSAVVDGAQWIVEVVDGEQYHVVDRWSPPERDAFRELGLYFLRLARIQIESDAVY